MKGDKIKYWSGYKYQTAEAYSCQTELRPPHDIQHPFFSISIFGVVTAEYGYAWDGASGPTIDTKSSMRASLIHDILYQAMGLGLLDRSFREQADRELRKICIEDGMWHWRAEAWYLAVRKFGENYGKEPEKVTVAP